LFLLLLLLLLLLLPSWGLPVLLPSTAATATERTPW
jgi:hypothetical protein